MLLYRVLAVSMLPDGAETQLDDWTIFFLNQAPFNTISPVLALETPEVKPEGLGGSGDVGSAGNKPDLLCVLNLVRMKHDKSLDRYVCVFRGVYFFLSLGLTDVVFSITEEPKCARWRYAHDIHSFKYSRCGVRVTIYVCPLLISIGTWCC